MSNEEIIMADSEKNINTASIEELINSNLDSAAAEVLGNTATDEGDTSVETSEPPQETATEAKPPKEIDLDELLDAADIELNIEPEIQAEVEPEELNVEPEPEVAEVASTTDLPETAQTEETHNSQVKSVEEPEQSDSIDSLESEVSELESEIQTQMDKLVIKADHLKANIQNELKRVSADNEQLQQQVAELSQQLSDAEEKVQGLAEVQDRQQVTIQKLIRILKGINTKITHLYDEN